MMQLRFIPVCSVYRVVSCAVDYVRQLYLSEIDNMPVARNPRFYLMLFCLELCFGVFVVQSEEKDS
jgi:hypothetical protein